MGSVIVAAPADEPNDFNKKLNMIIMKFEGKPDTKETWAEITSDVIFFLENNLKNSSKYS